MKKILSLIIAVSAALAIVSCGTTHHTTIINNNPSIAISWDNLALDSSFEAFGDATPDQQIDMLRDLCTIANTKFNDIKNMNQLREFEGKMDMLRRYYRKARKESVAIENELNDLNRKVEQLKDILKVK